MSFWYNGRSHHWTDIHSRGPATRVISDPRAVLEELLQSYQDIFEEPRGLPPPRRHDHQIHLLPSAPPVAVRPCRYPQLLKDEIERQCEDMLAQGISRESISPFSSPVLLVRKHDNTWRFCVDYRALNDATGKDKLPIPVVDELLDELKGARFFTKIDLRSGYHQVRMHPPLTALLKREAFTWIADAEAAFLALKLALVTAPLLQLPDFTKRFVVDCDASGTGFGAVLHQGDGAIAFFSRLVAPHHTKLPAYERELIGLVKAVRHWRPLPLGSCLHHPHRPLESQVSP